MDCVPVDEDWEYDTAATDFVAVFTDKEKGLMNPVTTLWDAKKRQWIGSVTVT